MNMKTAQTTILSPSGMHARPAGELAKLAKSFAPTKIRISDSVKTKDAASVMSIMSMGLKQGTVVTVCAEGEREQEALDAVLQFISSVTD